MQYNSSQNCHDVHLINTVFIVPVYLVTTDWSCWIHPQSSKSEPLPLDIFYVFWQIKTSDTVLPLSHMHKCTYKTILLFSALITESRDHPCGESIPATTSRYWRIECYNEDVTLLVSKKVTWMDNVCYWSPHELENTKFIYVARNLAHFFIKKRKPLQAIRNKWHTIKILQLANTYKKA